MLPALCWLRDGVANSEQDFGDPVVELLQGFVALGDVAGPVRKADVLGGVQPWVTVRRLDLGLAPLGSVEEGETDRLLADEARRPVRHDGTKQRFKVFPVV